ncbi:prepilin-type N-terminal cleavage/methylation domain-containing protein [Candidatus Uhrbacteria bacterium]|nr:prepilin-type N-terminal cleavage/methylation domain-containing protein [Candidatus Uhrbacteria bacterium]
MKKQNIMKTLNPKPYTLTPRKGFTLIELLIVIAIIGILSSVILVGLGGARASARDARRIGDLKQIQAALEIYFNKCTHYPGTSGCTKTPPANWTAFSTALINANIGINNVPNDPISGENYRYSVATMPLEKNHQVYVLGAKLEQTNSAVGTYTIPTGVATWGGVPLSCTGATEYCTGI